MAVDLPVERPFLLNIFRNMLWSKHFLNASFPFSFNLLGSGAKVWIFCIILIVNLAPTQFFQFSPLNSFFCSLSCEINNKVSSLLHKIPFLLSTLSEPTRRHLCFQRIYDVIIPLYSEYSAPQRRMLGIHSVFPRIGIATRSNGYSGLGLSTLCSQFSLLC